jgi:glycosyltransferase involved in cell wall biosynthesis
MGVDTDSKPLSSPEKLYDLIYIGTLRQGLMMDQFLQKFLNCCPDKTMLILGSGHERLAHKYQSFPNIRFKGPVPHEDVAAHLASSRFALNLVEDREPFSKQTSTKFLEYLYHRIPVISSDYEWVRQFQTAYGGSWFYLSGDLRNLDWNIIETHAYQFPEMESWSWEKKIDSSGVLELIRNLSIPNVVR